MESSLRNGLRLPFICPVRDVLDFIQLAHTRLHVTAWRILMPGCVLWHWVLIEAKEDYLHLTDRKFFGIHSVRSLLKSISRFRSRPNWRLVNFEVRHSNAKHWQRNNSWVSGGGWE